MLWSIKKVVVRGKYMVKEVFYFLRWREMSVFNVNGKIVIWNYIENLEVKEDRS